MNHVVRAARHLAMEHARNILKVRIDTHVNHMKLGVVQTCENIDRRSVREVIQNHLVRHLPAGRH